MEMRDYLTLQVDAIYSKGTSLVLLFFVSQSQFFNNESNSYPKTSLNGTACSWAVHFTSVDKRYIWTSF